MRATTADLFEIALRANRYIHVVNNLSFEHRTEKDC